MPRLRGAGDPSEPPIFAEHPTLARESCKRGRARAHAHGDLSATQTHGMPARSLPQNDCAVLSVSERQIDLTAP